MRLLVETAGIASLQTLERLASGGRWKERPRRLRRSRHGRTSFVSKTGRKVRRAVPKKPSCFLRLACPWSGLMAITVRVSVCVFVWLCVCARACLLAHRCIRVLRRGLSAGWIGRPTLPAFVMHASRRFPFRLCRGEERHGGLPGVKRADLGDGGDRSDEDDTDTTLVDGVGAVDGLGEGGTQMHQGPAAADGEKGKETSEGQVKTNIQIYIYRRET